MTPRIDECPEHSEALGISRKVPSKADIIGGLFFHGDVSLYLSIPGYSVHASITQARRMDKTGNCWEISGLAENWHYSGYERCETPRRKYRAQFVITRGYGWIEYTG